LREDERSAVWLGCFRTLRTMVKSDVAILDDWGSKLRKRVSQNPSGDLL